MYKILGADQNEYGPVTIDQVKQWIAEGRANAKTLARAEGSTDWKPLSELPEFASLFAAKPPTLPQAERGDAEGIAREVLATDYALDIGSCLSRAWELLKKDFWPIVGISALISVIIMAANAAYVGILVLGPLYGGLLRFYLKKIRGEQAGMEDAFSGFSIAFLQLFLGALVSSLLTGVGLMLCILPGIYLFVAWQFTLPLIIDKKLDFWPAMELSRKVIHKYWWSFLLFTIVNGLINVAGVLACCVGAFVTAPLTGIALMYAYEDIFQSRAQTPAPTV